MTHTKVKGVLDLTAKERASCLRLNLGGRGAMKERFLKQEGYELNGIDTGAKVILHYDHNGWVTGWALCWKHNTMDVAYFYVRSNARRRGVGTRLMNRALKLNPDMKIFPWDETSAKFFTKFPVHVPDSYKREYGL